MIWIILILIIAAIAFLLYYALRKTSAVASKGLDVYAQDPARWNMTAAQLALI